ncbi:MAG: hypothetical protein EBU31_14680 [Proteobacteria bacterium]|nr:hypothetical protein [Pseudomonadota bacterium]
MTPFIIQRRSGIPLARQSCRNRGSHARSAKKPATSSSASPSRRRLPPRTYATSAVRYRSIRCLRSAPSAVAPASPRCSITVSCASIHVAWVLGKWSTGMAAGYPAHLPTNK